VDRSGGGRARFIGHAQQPEGVAAGISPASRERFSVAKIGRHVPYKVVLPERVARTGARTQQPMESPNPASHVRHEPRWHASLAVLAALVLYVTLPNKLTIGPIWIAPMLVLVVLIPLSILAPRRHKETARMRVWGILLIAIVNFFNIASVLLLIAGFFHPAKVQELQSAANLLRHGLQIWLTNVLVFALWFWELDSNGPEARAHTTTASEFKDVDFLFPQISMQIAGESSSCIEKGWKPQFLDYLYVSFTNSTAFSPADTMPLTRMAKMLMLVEALISLVTIAIVLARSVSLIQ
jgi:uncharacterized membrane protein